MSVSKVPWCQLVIVLLTLFTNVPMYAQDLGSTQPDVKKQAREFTIHITKAIRLIHDEHTSAPTKTQLARWAIHGLYEKSKQPLPKFLARRLQKLDLTAEGELERLMYDARLHLGPGKELRKLMDLQIALKAVFAKLEPGAPKDHRSEWFSPEVLCQIFPICPSNYCGVGLQLRTDPKTKYLQVITPAYNSPAHKAGIRAGDLVTTITRVMDAHGKSLPKPDIHSTKGMTPKDANKLILGQEGTRVTLTIVPAGQLQKSATRD